MMDLLTAAAAVAVLAGFWVMLFDSTRFVVKGIGWKMPGSGGSAVRWC